MSLRRARMLSMTVFATVLTACGDGGGSSDSETSSNVSVSAALVIAGQTTQATLRDDGRVVDPRIVSWSSSDSAVARISPDGFVTTFAAGEVTITARRGEERVTTTLTATPPPTDIEGPVVELSPPVLPTDGGNGVAIIVDGTSTTAAAYLSPALPSNDTVFLERLPGTSRFVTVLSRSQVAAMVAQGSTHGVHLEGTAFLGDLGTLESTGAARPDGSRLLFAPILPADAAPISVEVVTADVQRSAHVVNLRNDGIGEDGIVFDVTRTFYRHFGDVYDYLVFNEIAFPVASPHFVGVRNRVEGLGLDVYDRSADYGASATGALLGIIDFSSNYFDLADQLTSHEMGHAFMTFIASPLASGFSHWSVSSACFGIMGGESFPIGSYAMLTPLEEGDFRVDPRPARAGYNDVELYLLGLADISEVGPHVVFTDQTQSITLGATLRGPTTQVMIDEIVAANGSRRPAWDGEAKIFRMATVVVSRGRLLTPFEMAYYDRQAARGEATTVLDGDDFAAPFFVNTGGRGILTTRID